MNVSRKTITVLLTVILSSLIIQPAAANMKIFACEPEWGALVNELGGDLVSVYTATTAFQDPHHIQARPSLIAKMRSADLLVCTGSELEIGWLPVLLRQSGNSRVQPGKPGNFATTDYVTMLDKPDNVDRSQGDVHSGGNPHIQTNPHNILKVAQALSKRLQQIDVSNTTTYMSRYKNFNKRWQQALGRWDKKAATLRGVKIVVHHKAWAYMLDWLGMISVATLESKPGVPPSAGHLSEVLQQLHHQQARMVIRAAYQQGRPDEWLSEHAKIPAVVLPFTVGGTPAVTNLFSLYDETIEILLRGIK